MIAPDATRSIADAIAASALAVLRQRNPRALASEFAELAREIGNNAAQVVVLMVDE